MLGAYSSKTLINKVHQHTHTDTSAHPHPPPTHTCTHARTKARGIGFCCCYFVGFAKRLKQPVEEAPIRMKARLHCLRPRLLLAKCSLRQPIRRAIPFSPYFPLHQKLGTQCWWTGLTDCTGYICDVLTWIQCWTACLLSLYIAHIVL